MSAGNELASMSGTEWPGAVERIWNSNRSRFATEWDALPHHDQVTIYRILTREPLEGGKA